MTQQNVTGTLVSILANQLQPDGSMRKVALQGPVSLHANGLRAENGISENYPDTDCALMQYAREHYDFWRGHYPAKADRFATPGIFGENLSSIGLTEQNVCPGDIFALGTAHIQVSWGREACQTMATRLEDDDAPEIMHREARNGWFYRVLQPGEIQRNDRFTLLDRVYAGWPLSRVQACLFGINPDRADLETLNTFTLLAASWREQIEAKLRAYR
ncbi:MOSC domain-containing protein [Atlantibacter sp.]|uniref:MOSC domain-containing protein n=1 Tax=Atlantibacter sp. TaxID=1903473 RepID=UPI0028AEF6EB|nr:MOSC domain-containing protein [Atlantibacter sp.]